MSTSDMDKSSTYQLENHAPTLRTDPMKPITEHIEGVSQLLTSDGKVRLVPTPTSSPRDPLNFATWRKSLIFATVVLFSTAALSAVGGFGALAGFFFGLYIPQGVPPEHVARLLTWPSLFTGLGNFVFIPLALTLGRRPVFIVASCMLVASSVWAACSGTSFNSHFAARLVLGFSAGATESLLPLIITDISFLSQRGQYFGMYWVLQSILTAILNVGSSFEAINLAWQWYYWIFVIISAVGTVMVIFLMPETKFARPAFAIDGQIARVDAYGNMIILSDDEAREASITSSDIEKIDGGGLGDAPEGSLTYLETLKPMNRPEPNSLSIIAGCYVDMVKALLDPAIIFALGASSMVLGVNIAISLSFATVLEKQYGWSIQNTGLIYLGSVPAGVLAYFTAGWLGDKMNLYFAKRNGGVHLPEHRLPALILPAITSIPISLMYGFCADAAPKVHWFSIVFSFNWLVFFFISVLITTTTYAVEAMTHRAGAALVMVVGGKNIISFGMSTAIVPLIQSGAHKYAYSTGILVGVEAAWLLLGIPLYFYMPKFRAWRTSKVKGL